MFKKIFRAAKRAILGKEKDKPLVVTITKPFFTVADKERPPVNVSSSEKIRRRTLHKRKVRNRMRTKMAKVSQRAQRGR